MIFSLVSLVLLYVVLLLFHLDYNALFITVLYFSILLDNIAGISQCKYNIAIEMWPQLKQHIGFNLTLYISHAKMTGSLHGFRILNERAPNSGSKNIMYHRETTVLSSLPLWHVYPGITEDTGCGKKYF